MALDPSKLAARLWGDWYYHHDARAFRRKAPPGGANRAFVTFVLEPLYRIYSTILGESFCRTCPVIPSTGNPAPVCAGAAVLHTHLNYPG